MPGTRPHRLHWRAGLLAGVVLATASGCAAPAPPASGTALTNFTLIDGTDRTPAPASALHIGDDGRILWVGPAADLATHTSSVAVDLSGAFVIPGLINLHGHVGNTVEISQTKENSTPESVRKDLALYASYGVTTVFSMGSDQDVVFPIRAEQRAGTPTTARIFSAGQGLMLTGGYGGLAGVSKEVGTVAEARAEVDRQAAKGVDAIKLWLDDDLGAMRKMPAEMTQAIIDAAHAHQVRVLAHVFYLEDAKRLAGQGIDGFVHLVRDQPVDQALIDSMKAHGTWQVAGTLAREASFAVGANPTFAADPFFTAGVTPRTVELFTAPDRLKTIAAGPNYARYPAFLETAKQNLKALYDADVPIGFGTDSGPPGRFPGYFEHWELELMVEAGFTPAQAIAAATRRAAEFLGKPDLGTIEASKWADLVVLDANPLDDIRNTRTIRAVYVAGQPVPVVGQ